MRVAVWWCVPDEGAVRMGASHARLAAISHVTMGHASGFTTRSQPLSTSGPLGDGAPPVRVYLFGSFRASTAAGEPLHGLNGKAQELLSYLVLHRRRASSREVIASALWEHGTTAQARAHLRKALWQLRNGLGEASACACLDCGPEYVRLDTAAVWCDAVALEDAWSGAHGHAGADLDADEAEVLAAAVALYRDDLLPGWYHEWCLFERERLQIHYLDLLYKLVGYSEACGAIEEGLQFAEHILAVDPAREWAHRSIMRLRYTSGDRVGAIRQYGRCVRALEREFGLAPSTATEALLVAVRQERRADDLAEEVLC